MFDKVIKSVLSILILTSCINKTKFTYESEDGEPIYSISSLITPNGEKIITGYSNGKIRIWGTDGFEPLLEFQAHNTITRTIDGKERNWIPYLETLAIHPNGKILATATQYEIKIWNVENGNLIERFESHPEINDLSFSDDGIFLLSAGSYIGVPRDLGDPVSEMVIREVSNWQKQDSIDFGAFSQISKAKFVPKSHNIAVIEPNGIVKIWNQSNQAVSWRKEVNVFGRLSVVFSKDGSRLFTVSFADYNRSIDILEVSSGKSLSKISDAHGTEIKIVGENKIVLLDSFSNVLEVWDLTTKKMLDSKKAFASTLNLKSNGDIITTGYGFQVWKLDTGNKLKKVKEISFKK